MREVGFSLLLFYEYDLLGHGGPFKKLFQQFYEFVVFLWLFSITTYTLVLLILHINEILSFFFPYHLKQQVCIHPGSFFMSTAIHIKKICMKLF
jgi:hypothetical protein